MAKRKAPFDPAKAAATTRRVSLPPDPDETNDERALYAMKAARAFAKETDNKGLQIFSSHN